MIGFSLVYLDFGFWSWIIFLLLISHRSTHVVSQFYYFVFYILATFRVINLDLLTFDLFSSQNEVTPSASSALVSEIAKARQHIKSSLERVDGASALSGSGVELFDRISSLEKDNSQLRGVVDGLQKLVISLEGRLNKLEGGSSVVQVKPTPASAPSKPGKGIYYIKRISFKSLFDSFT